MKQAIGANPQPSTQSGLPSALCKNVSAQRPVGFCDNWQDAVVQGACVMILEVALCLNLWCGAVLRLVNVAWPTSSSPVFLPKLPSRPRSGEIRSTDFAASSGEAPNLTTRPASVKHPGVEMRSAQTAT